MEDKKVKYCKTGEDTLYNIYSETDIEILKIIIDTIGVGINNVNCIEIKRELFDVLDIKKRKLDNYYEAVMRSFGNLYIKYEKGNTTIYNNLISSVNYKYETEVFTIKFYKDYYYYLELIKKSFIES